jgi:hypothetical protein
LQVLRIFNRLLNFFSKNNTAVLLLISSVVVKLEQRKTDLSTCAVRLRAGRLRNLLLASVFRVGQLKQRRPSSQR